ncbi:fibronectin type III domain-containing protein [Flavobacterium sp. GCM10023249]|uniref:fibronectin type III domain-containing protein n=1 Tax=unclassified Flavobacterium TaxID=196869 RepID=UPI0036213BFD
MKQNYKFVAYPLCKALFLWLLFAFFAITTGHSQTFTDNTPNGTESWVVPAGVTSVTVQIWGSGGSGGGSNSNGAGGSGGGGGGYSTKTFTVAAGQTISYTVGAGATATTVANGNSGNQSTLTHAASTTSLTANGGGAGLLNSATGGAGGTASGGSTNTSGSNGGAGGASGGNGGDGGNTTGTGGAGQTNADGTAGGAPGGGGGGGERGGGNRSGGAGANGRVIITYALPGPSNDECSTAIALTVNTTCSYSSYTTVSATNSTGIPAPGCASYSGGDVWFSVTVPAGGQVTVDLVEGGMTDSGMAWYTGSCGSLTLLQCDDDSSTNGMMSSITRTGLTPGSTIYIRVWEYGNDNRGTFGICATAPVVCTTPANQPTALTLTPSGGSINGSFTASSSAPTNYLVVYNTTNTVPNPANGTSYTIGGAVPGGTVADNDSNTSFSVSGLSSNTTYYFFIFAYNTTGCTGGPLYLESPTAGPLTGSALTGLSYCTPTTTSGSDYISGFTTTGGINNISYTSTAMNTGGYGDYFNTRTVSGTAGGSIDFSETYVGGSHGFRIWVDWNNDGDFADASESVYTSGAIATGHAGTFNIPALQAAGNYRMRIRAYWNNNTVDPCATGLSYSEALDFKMTVVTPIATCPGNPSNITASAITGTTATISWTAASPAPISGYQISVSTTNGTPSSTNTTAAGVTTIGLTGLTAETTYYVYVRANCGATQGYWIGPISFKTPCASGAGTGTTTLGCPSVVSGGLGLNGSDPAAITCSTTGCVDLEATYLQLGQTSSYTAQAIPYNPPYQFGCLANSVSVNTDDVWSPTINLPFNFCFYGTNYNQCLIGSNGVLTFDTANNTAGGTSAWEFASNLPNTSLFRNTIFGVYQDIDPSKGGTVGWELVTLSTGCRALVASWKDIPMFSSSCNSMLYTGMMVLYENTNIIEVYIKEKNVCGSWNAGNAIVGVQNAAGTTGTAAPNRNGLDTNWTTTNEAWRFVPSGTAITSIKWYQGAGTTGPVVGTTDVINVCPSTTTTYTAEVTYSMCNGSTVKVTDQTTVTVSGNKVWNGSVNTDWNTAGNWTPSGVPNNTQPVTIANVTNKPVINGGAAAQACSLTIQTGSQLTVATNNNITVTNAVTVQGTGNLILNNGANLIQINNVANSGNIQSIRNANIRRQDYVYWSSPVANFPVTSVSPGTTGGYIYKWLPTTTTGYASNFGNWAATTENMVIGKGYIVRGPNAYSTTAITNFTATFTGVPNNGIITIPISRSNYNGLSYTGPTSTLVTANDDNWNLVGNPYPSSIRAIDFLNANTNISGFINVWTHGTLPVSSVDPFYANYNYNYTTSDYITYNASGASSGPGAFNGYIGSGQGFYVLMNHSSAATTENLTFNNSMRSATYSNAQFYRNSSNNDTQIEPENNRIWLDLIKTADNTNRRTLLAYVEGATNEKDRIYDAVGSEKLNFNFYSIVDNEMQLIQGRALPFDSNDKVTLGINIAQSGEYKIGIGALDGLFTKKSQVVLLEDKYLNVTHNLKESPYTFTANQGRTDNRFVIKYIDGKISNGDDTFINDIKIFAMSNLNVESSNIDITSVTVYDVIGKKLLELNNIKQKQITISQLKPTTNVILVKVALEDGTVVTKKVVY